MINAKLKQFIRKSFLYPNHIGNYIRELYFWDFVKKLPEEKIKKILDAGCGSGNYAFRIAKMLSNSQVDAVDISSSLFPRKQISNIRFTKLNLLKFNEKEKYDFVYCIDVLEHIRENKKVLINIYRALKNNGYFYLHIPYDKNNKYILPSFIFKEFNKWAKKEHVGKSYNLEELSNLLKEIGYVIINEKYTFGFLGNLAWEIDRATDKLFLLKILVSPILKVFSYLSVKINYSKGNGVAIMAQKKKEAYPLVSVILPTYNRASLLSRAINSVINQTYRNLEIIVVDDGSSDNTEEVIKKFQKKDKRIKYIICNKHRGVSAARNTGIKRANGEYIAFQDSDDEWLPEKTETQMKIFRNRQNEIGLVYSDMWRILENRQIKYWHSPQDYAVPSNISIVTIIVKKECFKKAGMFNLGLKRLVDLEWLLRLSKKYRFYQVKIPLANYYETQKSISTNHKNYAFALRYILKNHLYGSHVNKKVIARFEFLTAQALFLLGETKQGKEYFSQAIKKNPFDLYFILVVFISLFGERFYKKILSFKLLFFPK